MSSEPLVSVSGVRGVVGESFTEELVRAWAGALALSLRATPAGRQAQRSNPDGVALSPLDALGVPRNDVLAVLGRDTRPSGEQALRVAAETLAAHGVQPIIVGVAPTPTLQLAVTHHRAAGGLIVTASHNPVEWNGLKFLGPDGVFFSTHEMQVLQHAADRTGTREAATTSGSNSATFLDDRAMERHVENVLALPLDVSVIRRRRFRVVLDPVNGTGALAVPPLLEKLGCAVMVINGEPNGKFAHTPEPTPANLTELGDRVRAERADLGVAVDPDADRLVLVDETGTVLSEEYTVTLAALSVLSSTHSAHFGSVQNNTLPKCVAVNLSTTRMVDDVARQFGATVVRTPVGERHVVEDMRTHGAVIGGEGNGGVIYPASHEGRDSLVGVALILDLLARPVANFRSFRRLTSEVGNVALSRLVSSLPHYVMVKEKLPLGDRSQLPKLTEQLRQLAERLPRTTTSVLDGIRLDTPDGWVHLRPSNTEPVIRLIAEASSEAQLIRLLAAVRAAAPASEVSAG